MKKVSFVCTTYRRATCVQRLVAQYYNQTYQNKELIILNTDTEYPITKAFDDPTVIIINNNTDYITNTDYTNRGQICRDAVTHATGDYFMLADDDDIYLPWHIQQAVDKIEEVGNDAWKPEMSFFATPHELRLAMNTLEASVIVKMHRIRQIGFRMDITGMEGLSWYTTLRDEKQLDEHYKDYIPSYCFNWADPLHIAGHKQSGNIDHPNNFQIHKKYTIDIMKHPLVYSRDVMGVYDELLEYIRQNKSSFPPDLLEKYVMSTVGV